MSADGDDPAGPANAPQPPISTGPSAEEGFMDGNAENSNWTCAICSLTNPNDSCACGVCATPRPSAQGSVETEAPESKKSRHVVESTCVPEHDTNPPSVVASTEIGTQHADQSAPEPEPKHMPILSSKKLKPTHTLTPQPIFGRMSTNSLSTPSGTLQSSAAEPAAPPERAGQTSHWEASPTDCIEGIQPVCSRPKDKLPATNGFYTANGRSLAQPSTETLNSARKLLSETSQQRCRRKRARPRPPPFRKPSRLAVSSTSSCEQSADESAVNLKRKCARPPPTNGFVTLSGKPIGASKKSMAAAKRLLRDPDSGDKSDHKPPATVGFVSGSGRPVSISKDSMRAARARLGDGVKSTGNGADLPPPTNGFVTLSGKPIGASKKSMAAAKRLLRDPDSGDKSDHKPPATVGFVSGSGRPVSISKDSMRAARAKLSGGQTDDRCSDEMDTTLPPPTNGFVTLSGKRAGPSRRNLQTGQTVLRESTVKQFPNRLQRRSPDQGNPYMETTRQNSVPVHAVAQSIQVQPRVDKENRSFSTPRRPSRKIARKGAPHSSGRKQRAFRPPKKLIGSGVIS